MKRDSKAAARREKIQRIAKAVVAMDDNQRQALVGQVGSIMTVEGHSLTVRNACMLALQREGVSVVGGYRQWQAAGRQVRKGEKSLGILAPRQFSKESEDGTVKAGVYFQTAAVFDVSQTEPAEVLVEV